MVRTRRIAYTFLLSILFTIIILGFTENIAKAATTDFPDYHFEIESSTIDKTEPYELKMKEAYVSVIADGWAAPSTVKWSSTSPGVVSLEETSTPNRIKMNRVGPGYTTIEAVVTQDGYTKTINFQVLVKLEVNHQDTGTIIATTNNDRILVMDAIDQEKTISIKYTDTSTASGSAILASTVKFESSNPTVVKVDETGKIKAIGAGMAIITISTTTVSNKNVPFSIPLKVTVRPTFSFTYTDKDKKTVTCNSVQTDTSQTIIYNTVPSNFVINSNAIPATNLIWQVYNCVGDKETLVPAGESSKMTYSITDSNNVTFEKVKAGTYKIYAYTYVLDGKGVKAAPYAYLKIYVPIDLGDREVVMNVGDTFNLLDNTNLTGTTVFVEPSDYDLNIAELDTASYVITAKKKGSVTINLVYDTGNELFEGITVGNMSIKVTVIDGISLSTTKATIYTKGTLQLAATVTENTSAITWDTSDKNIATVTNGLVTGLKPGTVTITAKQKVNGVIKKATCIITVQQSVETVVVDPLTTTLEINGFKTLHATITPKELSSISLKWKSSNEEIVKVVESNDLTATIQGVSGGYAVISAINQDNVVVGYCAVTVQQPVTSIVLSETAVTASLTLKELQLRATVYPDNAVNQDVIWSSTDPTKATVNQNGLVKLLKPGTVTIIATSDDNSKAVAYCNITILIPVVSLALDQTNKTMYVGESARLSYVVLPTNSSNSIVTWVSTNTSVAAVDAAGKVTAKGVGTAVIILRTADGGYSAYCTITVKQVATTVKLDVNTLALKTGQYYYFKTTLTPNGSTDNDLVWESSDTKVAVVDEDGKVTAKNAGTAVIMARTQAGGVAYCKVTVTQSVDGLVLNYSEKTIFKGESFDLEASISPSSATELKVTWKSSNVKVATISDKGVVKGIVGGVVVITCTTVDGGYSATCVVTVKEKITSIKLNYETYNLGVDKSVRLTATISNETATNQKIKWSSSNENVAIVSQTGKVTGIARGYASITAMALDGSESEVSCEIRVVIPVNSVTLNKTSMSMFVGESKKLKAKVGPKNVTYKKAKWSSSDTSVAIVDEDGIVIGIKAGSTMITAEAADNSGKKAICYVTVNDRLASTGITLQDKAITMVPNETKIVEMVLIPVASTDDVTWSSDNSAVASVNKDSGKITAKSTGTAYVTVMTDSGKTATVEVTVIGLNQTKLVTEQYTEYNLSVEGSSDTVKWHSENPLVATVSNNGTVSTKAVGTTNIVATVNGRKLYCKVVVKKIS